MESVESMTPMESMDVRGFHGIQEMCAKSGGLANAVSICAVRTPQLMGRLKIGNSFYG